MLDYIRFLRDVYLDLRQASQKQQMLQNLVLTEARFNNDLLQIILRSDCEKMARQHSAVFQELQTHSADLVNALGLAPHSVFDERRDPTEEELLKLDRSGVSLQSLKRRPQTELWEFSIRKIRLLKALAQSGSLGEANIALRSRCRNLEYATRTLAGRMGR